MKEYDSKAFIDAIMKKTNGFKMVKCPICGGNQFTTTEEFASIIIGKDYHSINLGPSVPAGMIICQNCGHMDFFSLGILGLINNGEDKKDGE